MRWFFGDSSQPKLLRLAIIVIATLLTYVPAYRGDWLWDDDQLLTENAAVQSGSLAGLREIWLAPGCNDYFPLSYTALWVQWPLFGKHPAGYHVTSVLLHAASAVLLWRLLDRMRVPGAWLSGVVFAVHPVCVESVAWIAEIKNTLSLPLFLLAAIFWVEQDETAASGNSLRTYGFAVACFLLSMLAKPSAAAFPLITLLYAWWKRGTVTRQDVGRALPLLGTSLALGLITISFQHGRAIGDERLPIGGVDSRLATAGMAIVFYVSTILWPVNLLPNYPQWETNPPLPWQFSAWILISAVCAWSWACRDAKHPPHWGRHLLFGSGFFLLAAAPILGFIPMSYMRISWVADHFIYLPMIGVVALVCAAAAHWARQAPPAVKPAAAFCALVVVGLCAVASYRYSCVFTDEDTLWAYTLERNSAAWMAHNRLGHRSFTRGDGPAALPHFVEAARLRPDLWLNRNNLALALAALGRHDEAAHEYEEACRVASPSMKPRALANLGAHLLNSGRPAEAKLIFGYLAGQFPRKPEFANNWALALARTGNREAAIRQWRRALELEPDNEPAREALARALAGE